MIYNPGDLDPMFLLPGVDGQTADVLVKGGCLGLICFKAVLSWCLAKRGLPRLPDRESEREDRP